MCLLLIYIEDPNYKLQLTCPSSPTYHNFQDLSVDDLPATVEGSAF